MQTLFSRWNVLLFVGLCLVLLQASTYSSHADSRALQAAKTEAAAVYGVVGPGLWEAECATLAGTWRKRNAARASKQSCDNDHSYIESSSNTSKVCLTFSNADRVRLSYVAGNYKGKVNALITFTDGATEPKKFNTYLDYTEPVSGTITMLAVEEFDENFQEGDLDSSGASNATQTFRAFRWIWEQDPAFPNKGGTICVNPRGLPGITGGSAMISLDYFLVARGNKMAVRGVGTEFTPMTQGDVNATWNYNATNFKLPESGTTTRSLAPMNAANWDGFVPKISGVLSSQITTSTVLSIITNTRGTTTGVPKYWIVFNEEDNAQWFANGTQPDPASSYYIDHLVNWMHLVINTYEQAGETPPKFIIESGSQYHAPSLSNPTVTGDWGLQPECDITPANWGCTQRSSVWIHQFWSVAKSRLQSEGLFASIAGFGGHFYQLADPRCYANQCALDLNTALNYTQALKNWATQNSGIPNAEIWLVETSTNLYIDDPYCPGGTIYAQRDLQKCNNTTYNVRNYVGKLQDALIVQNIVNRWAWYADRYGRTEECTGEGLEPQDDTPDGQDAALNADCDIVILSPFGNNAHEAATYR